MSINNWHLSQHVTRSLLNCERIIYFPITFVAKPYFKTVIVATKNARISLIRAAPNQQTPNVAAQTWIWVKPLIRNLTDSPHLILLNLHVTLCREHLIMYGFWGHPFDWQFSVLCSMVHFLGVHVTRQSKVSYLDQLAFTNENISRRQVTMNESFTWQKLLCKIRKGSFDYCNRSC